MRRGIAVKVVGPLASRRPGANRRSWFEEGIRGNFATWSQLRTDPQDGSITALPVDLGQAKFAQKALQYGVRMSEGGGAEAWEDGR